MRNTLQWGVWIIAVVITAFISLRAFSGGAKWQSETRAGQFAASSGNYAEAEKDLRAALSQAERFGPSNARYRESLDNLSTLYESESNPALSGIRTRADFQPAKTRRSSL